MIIPAVSRVVERSMSLRSARGAMCLAVMVMMTVSVRPAAAQSSSTTVIDMPPPPAAKVVPESAQEEVTVSQRPHLGRVAFSQYSYNKRRPGNTWYNIPRRGISDSYTQRWLISPYGRRHRGYYDAYLWPSFWNNCYAPGGGRYSYRWSFGW